MVDQRSGFDRGRLHPNRFAGDFRGGWTGPPPVTGEYNYYEQNANRGEGTLNLELDQISTDLTFPIAESVDGLIQSASTEIVAINGVVLTLDPR